MGPPRGPVEVLLLPGALLQLLTAGQTHLRDEAEEDSKPHLLLLLELQRLPINLQQQEELHGALKVYRQVVLVTLS